MFARKELFAAVAASATFSAGTSRLRGLPAGRCVLRVHDARGQEVSATEVEAGTEGVLLR